MHYDTRPPICAEYVRLPLHLAHTALHWAGKGSFPDDIQDLRCTLERHESGDHYSTVLDVTHSTALWVRWAALGRPEILLVLPDCASAGPDRKDACDGYEGHPGAHSWQLNDPWEEERKSDLAPDSAGQLADAVSTGAP